MKYVSHMALAAATIAAVTPAPRDLHLPGAMPAGARVIARAMTRTNPPVWQLELRAADTTAKATDTTAKAKDTTHQGTPADVNKMILQSGTPMGRMASMNGSGYFPKIVHYYNCISPKDNKTYEGNAYIMLNGKNSQDATLWLKMQDSLAALKDQCKLSRVDTVKSK